MALFLIMVEHPPQEQPTTRMTAHKLLLHPASPGYVPDEPAALLVHLQAIGLAGAHFQAGDESGYLAGEHFLQLITFLGCSPAIEFEPPDHPAERESAAARGAFCHLRAVFPGPDPVFRGSGEGRPPRCPACRRPARDWPQAVAAWRRSPGNNAWRCEHCGHAGRIHDLDFRHQGGFARTFIELWGIHPSEAVPVDALLSALATFSGCNWRYLYVND
jgi:hypothetical protein